ncbi:MAG: hypothetical protein JXA73_22850 [Acidobacteria bacterium]|nr:hypothetical protein [Acidobacteriota bacterium]
MKGANRKTPKYGDNSDNVLNVVSPAASDLVLSSMLDDVLEIARRRAKLLERMKQALLEDDMIALKNAAEVICGLREENLS